MTQRAALWLAIVLIAIAIEAPPAHAGFRVCNQFERRVSVAFGYVDRERGWVAEGWANIDPGQCKSVRRAELDNRYYYLYAKANGGTLWGGDVPFCVEHNKFLLVQSQYGKNTPDDCAKAGLDFAQFFKVDVGQDKDHTYNVVASNNPGAPGVPGAQPNQPPVGAPPTQPSYQQPPPQPGQPPVATAPPQQPPYQQAPPTYQQTPPTYRPPVATAPQQQPPYQQPPPTYQQVPQPQPYQQQTPPTYRPPVATAPPQQQPSPQQPPYQQPPQTYQQAPQLNQQGPQPQSYQPPPGAPPAAPGGGGAACQRYPNLC